MICNHLKELFQFCKEHDVRLSSTDLVRVVCKQCGIQEVCPSALVEEIDDAPARAAGTSESTPEAARGSS